MKKLLFVLLMVLSGQVMAHDVKCLNVNSVSTNVSSITGGSFGAVSLTHNLGRKPFGVPRSSNVFIAVWVLDLGSTTTQISIGFANVSGSPQPQDATISFDYF